MNKVVRQMALKSLKQHHSRTRILFLTITLSTALLCGALLDVKIQTENEKISQIAAYGSYQYAMEDVSPQTLDMFDYQPYLQAVNQMYCYGSTADGAIGYVKGTDLLPIRFLEGRLPENDHEIAIEKQLLDSCFPLVSIGDTFSLNYQLHDGKTREETLVLSGIIENYSSRMPTSSLSLITTAREYPAKVTLFYQTETQTPLLTDENIIENTAVLSKNIEANYTDYMASQTIVLGICFFCSLLLMNGLQQMSDEMADELSFLRAVGASKMQIAGILFDQIIVISLFALPIGIVTGCLFSWAGCLWQDKIFVFSMESLLEALVMMLVGIFVGASLPACHAATRSLTGKLVRHKKTLKIRHFKKLTPFYLMRRHMAFSRMKNLLLVFIMACSLSYLSDKLARLMQIKDEGIYQDYVDVEVTFHIPSFEPSELTKIKEISGIQSAHLLSESSHYDGMARKNQYTGENQISGIRVLVLDDAQFLDDQEREAFVSGKRVLIYLPEMLQSIAEGGSVSLYDEQEMTDETLTYLKSQHIQLTQVQDTSIQTGDRLTLSVLGEVQIGGILATNPFKKSAFSLSAYDLFVSPAFARQHDMTDFSMQYLLADYTEAAVDKTVYARLVSVLQPYQNHYHIRHYYAENIESQHAGHGAIIKLAIYIAIVILVDASLLFQLYVTRIQPRRREIGICQAVGMSKGQLQWMLAGEGLMIGTETVVLSLFFRLLPQFLTIMAGNSTYYFSWAQAFPLKTLGIDLIIYLSVLLLCTLVFYLPAKRLIDIPMIEKIRYKE